MKIKQYQIDAFATRAFEGNPAAVCPLESWLDDGILQAIAEENNLSETAFFVPSKKGFELRWFTPKSGIPEDPVTGSAHCTLAPYWANKLGKNILSARQVSKRGGNIACEVNSGRVMLSGYAVTFMEAEITF